MQPITKRAGDQPIEDSAKRLRPASEQPFHAKVLEVVTPIFEELISQKIIEPSFRQLLTQQNMGSSKQVKEKLHQVLKAILPNAKACEYTAFPSAANEAVQQKIVLLTQQLESLNPKHICGDNSSPPFCFSSNPHLAPLPNNLVLSQIHYFGINSPYFVPKILNSLSQFLIKFIEQADWVADFAKAKQQSDYIKQLINFTRLLERFEPTLTLKLHQVFLGLIQANLTERAKHRDFLPTDFLLTLGDLAERCLLKDLKPDHTDPQIIRRLQDLSANTKNSPDEAHACLTLLYLMDPTFAPQRAIKVLLGDGQERTLSPNECLLLFTHCNFFNVPGERFPLAEIPLTHYGLPEFEKFVAFIMTKNPPKTFQEWLSLFKIADYFGYQFLAKLVGLLNAQMIAADEKQLVKFLEIMTQLMSSQPDCTISWISRRDQILSEYLSEHGSKVRGKCFFEAIQKFEMKCESDWMKMGTFQVSQFCAPLFSGLKLLSGLRHIIFTHYYAPPLRHTFFETVTRVTELTLGPSWRPDHLGFGSLSVQILRVQPHNIPDDWRITLQLFPNLRELHYLSAPAQLLAFEQQATVHYPNLRIFVEGKEVFHGRNHDQPPPGN